MQKFSKIKPKKNDELSDLKKCRPRPVCSGLRECAEDLRAPGLELEGRPVGGDGLRVALQPVERRRLPVTTDPNRVQQKHPLKEYPSYKWDTIILEIWRKKDGIKYEIKNLQMKKLVPGVSMEWSPAGRVRSSKLCSWMV